ncbi:ATP phosphoribosyltransferase [Russula earlei]|uniref:ATP phosphoribosyltransferase n=1 Tax=Russula earlei TaxID=71964 RepID=A0ACC0TV15_9AGAM|nr:ATP phosphoribosyltransferase [Russula earlei]
MRVPGKITSPANTEDTSTMDPSLLDGRLLFAIPKKGRLHEKCLELLAGADIQFNRPNRLDVCLVQNHPIALVFLPAADIPSFVGKGSVDLGITGHDVILEAGMESLVTETLRLGFGKCALQVQVPEAGPLQSVEALAGKRIVTSFEYVGGSVEAACALGLADAIKSGETMRAAGLRPIATLLAHAHLGPLIEKITARIAGVIAARKYIVCQYNVRRAQLSAATAITPGRRAPTISPLEDSEWVAVSAMVERFKTADVMDQLVTVGAEDILVFNLDNSRV